MHRGMLTEVPLEADGVHAIVGGVESLERGERPVARTVVDVDDLERAPEPGERLAGPTVELVQRARLVVQRDDDGELWLRRSRTSRAQALGTCRSGPSVRASVAGLAPQYLAGRVEAPV